MTKFIKQKGAIIILLLIHLHLTNLLNCADLLWNKRGHPMVVPNLPRKRGSTNRLKRFLLLYVLLEFLVYYMKLEIFHLFQYIRYLLAYNTHQNYAYTQTTSEYISSSSSLHRQSSDSFNIRIINLLAYRAGQQAPFQDGLV